MSDHTQQMNDTLTQCIQDCMDCHRACITTMTHCLGRGGDHAAPVHIRALTDCAEICLLSAHYMLRDSHFHHHTCAVCALVCAACGDSCENLSDGDRWMDDCAKLCWHCAESCQQMAGAIGAALAAA